MIRESRLSIEAFEAIELHMEVCSTFVTNKRARKHIRGRRYLSHVGVRILRNHWLRQFWPLLGANLYTYKIANTLTMTDSIRHDEMSLAEM